MKSSLTPDEIDSLINEAEDLFPDSDFVASVREWFENHDFITDKQEDALNNIIDR